jgi:asparagine synthase (glutamine-hydrolysing)
MCGILGYISNKSIEKQQFQEASHAIRHRGTNAEGFYYNSNNTIAFAHQRLSIIDLSTGANQPFTSACGRYIIIYNGELYNFLQIKNDLQLHTHTHSDTEVIVEGFARMGAAIFGQLNGMFALAIFDTIENKIYLCRDRLGIKPLFIYQDENTIVFASEIKAIRRLKQLNFALNPKAIPAFLHLGFIPQPDTIYQNIQKFPTAAYAVISSPSSPSPLNPPKGEFSQTITYHTYWNIEKTLSNPKIWDFSVNSPLRGLEAAKKQLKELLFSSIERQLVADVPVGTFLSGGIDSSLVTAIASAIKKDKINTFSIGFDFNKFDESGYAQQVAAHLQTRHHPFLVREKDVVEQLHKIISVYDEPYADASAFPSMVVSELAKKHVTVALSGDGGDELFHGYGAYIWAERLQKRYMQLLHRPIYWATQLSKNNRIKRAGTLFNFSNIQHLRSHIFSQEQYFFSENELQQLLLNPNFNFDYINPQLIQNQSLTSAEQQAIWDINHYLKDDLLVKMDRASMQYALEVRVPLLDNTIVDFAMQLPPDFKINNGIQKYILKEVLYDFVPKAIFDRPKQGFSIPLIRWLKNDWNFLIDKYLNKTIVEKYNLVHYPEIESLKKRFLKNEDYLYNRIWVLILLHWWLIENEG